MVVVLTVCFYSFKSYYPFFTSVMIIDIELIFVGVKGVSGIASRATFCFLYVVNIFRLNLSQIFYCTFLQLKYLDSF